MKAYYTRQGLWTLFLVCAFPLHIWTIVFSLLDMSWVAERTNFWDAVGVIAYGLVFAFLESVVIWLVACLLGLLVSRRWQVGQRVTALGTLTLTTSFWGMAGSLYFLLNASLPPSLLTALAQSGHPLKLLYAIALVLVAPSIALPLFLILRFERFYLLASGLLDRLALLTTVYLALDAAGLVIVLLRNI